MSPQIAQEGAIQIFHEADSGMEEVIVGAVGVLQFEVLEYRLKNEYNIDIRRRDLSYSYIRWITSEGTDPRRSTSPRIRSGCRTSAATTCSFSTMSGASAGRSRKTPA